MITIIIITILSIYSIILIDNIDVFAQISSSETIETDKGRVQGLIFETVNKSMRFAAFKGIPYAKPPVKWRRFRPPEENQPWRGVLHTTDTSSSCPQYDATIEKYSGSENCLYLNVYTPKVDPDDKELRAVMVWIYGGAFVTGYVNTSRYGPDFILEEDIVVVAMSYRLGVFGFLNFNHTNATGNAGLKDQSLALRWVQKNIKNFGGDPDRVTIFGQSAGSVGVHLHKLSPMSRGLFSRSIAMSGSSINPWAVSTTDQSVSRAHQLARQLGIETTNVDEILDKMYKASVKRLLELTDSLIELVMFDLPYKPSVEDSRVAKEPFLPDCPVNLYVNGNFSQEPHILGFSADETISFAGSLASFLRLIRAGLSTITSVTGLDTITDIVRLRGVLNATVDCLNDLSSDVVDAGIHLTTDIFFIAGIDRVQQYLSAGEGPVYYYRNSFDYPQALHKVDGNQINGTAHSDDIAHIFWVSNSSQTLDTITPIGRQRRKMVKMWTNMAKYGNPTPNGTDDPEINITWPDSSSEGTCLYINTNYTIGLRPIDELINVIRAVISPIRALVGTCPASI